MNPLPTPTNATALANLEDILFNPAVLIALAFITGWAVKKILNWLGNKLTRSPIAKAIITAAGKSLQVLLPAYTVWLLVDHNMVHISASKQEYFKVGTNLLLSIAHTTTVYHMVLVPIAWAQKFADKTDNKLDDVLVPMISTVIRVAVVLVGTVKAVSIIDAETAKSVLALLATGAVAIGFAAQDTIKNIFGAVMLIIDQPFTLGDNINIGTHEGKVESLGLRSTVIVLLDGQRVAIPNGDLASRSIVNITRRDYIRAQDLVHLEMNTPAEKVKEAVEIIRDLLAKHEGFDHRLPPLVHVMEFGEWSINIRFMYWYKPNLAKQMDFNEKLMIQISEKFQKSGIRLAAQGTPQIR
jgi:MscS family membrane protein